MWRYLNQLFNNPNPVQSTALACTLLAITFLLHVFISSQNPISDEEALQLVQAHCQKCHSETPKTSLYSEPPAGLILKDIPSVLANNEKIYDHVVIKKDMPYNNLTGMTDQQRTSLGKWLQSK